MARDDDGTTAAVVVVGGAALLWLLLRLGSGGDGIGLGESRSLRLASALGGSGVDDAGGGGRRCALRLSGQGLTLDGVPITADEAARRCTEVDLVVTGDAMQGALDAVRAALAARQRKVHEKLPPVAPTGVAFALAPWRLR